MLILTVTVTLTCNSRLVPPHIKLETKNYHLKTTHNAKLSGSDDMGWATVKDGDTLALTIALLPIVFPQMQVRFSAYITYDWDFNKAWHPDGPPLAK